MWSLAGERCREGLPRQGHQWGERSLPSQLGQGSSTSHGTSAAPYQAPGAWEPWFPIASTKSYFPFRPCTHLLVASYLGPAKMKLEAGLGWWAEPSPITDGHQIVLGGWEDPALLHRLSWTYGGIFGQPGTSEPLCLPGWLWN